MTIELICAAAASEAACKAAMARALAAIREHEHEVKSAIELALRKFMEENKAHPDTHLMVLSLADVSPRWRPYMPPFVRLTPNAPQPGHVYFVTKSYFDIIGFDTTGGPPL